MSSLVRPQRDQTRQRSPDHSNWENVGGPGLFCLRQKLNTAIVTQLKSELILHKTNALSIIHPRLSVGNAEQQRFAVLGRFLAPNVRVEMINVIILNMTPNFTFVRGNCYSWFRNALKLLLRTSCAVGQISNGNQNKARICLRP